MKKLFSWSNLSMLAISALFVTLAAGSVEPQNPGETVPEEAVDPEPEVVVEPEKDIEEVVPPEILEVMEEYIPIHRGINPPNVEGCYLIQPMVAVYCQDPGGYAPGTEVIETYVQFSNQNNETLTLDYDEIEGSSTKVGQGSFISGEGNDFTVYFDTEGQSSGIPIRTALVISGTLTEEGISNLRYAFVMVEKGDDPNGYIMQEGFYRVFEDADGMSFSTAWPGSSFNAAPKRISVLHGMLDNVN